MLHFMYFDVFLYVPFFDHKERNRKKLSVLELHSLNNCMVRPEIGKLAYAQTMPILILSYQHCLLITLGTEEMAVCPQA